MLSNVVFEAMCYVFATTTASSSANWRTSAAVTGLRRRGCTATPGGSAKRNAIRSVRTKPAAGRLMFVTTRFRRFAALAHASRALARVKN